MLQVAINKVGRPSKIDEKTIRKLVEAFKFGATIEEACLYSNIGQGTYYDWFKKDNDFQRDMETAKLYPLLTSKKRIVKAIAVEKDTDTAKWLLERRQPELYATKSTIGLQGQINITVRGDGFTPPVTVNPLPDKQANQIDATIIAKGEK